MEISQGQIIQKPNKQELSSLFVTHHLNAMHIPVQFRKYIPYGLGVMAQTQFTIWELSQGQKIQKPNNQELSPLFKTHHLNVMHAPVKFHIFHTVKELWPVHILLYGTKSRQIIQKPNKQDLSSLFMTHHLNAMHAPVKFHKYIPYG